MEGEESRTMVFIGGVLSASSSEISIVEMFLFLDTGVLEAICLVGEQNLQTQSLGWLRTLLLL